MGFRQRFHLLAPAPPRQPQPYEPRVTFLDLPAELRLQIYQLALRDVTIHITPSNGTDHGRVPHALTRTSRQVRQEILPLMHALCPIRCSITDFNFDSLREWMARIPPDQEANLCKNTQLTIRFCTTAGPPKIYESLRKWLHMRADQYRPQPNWQYTGSKPDERICKDLRRRAKRMTDIRRQKELLYILKCIGIPAESAPGRPRSRDT